MGGVLSHTYIHTHGIRLSIRVTLNTKPALQVLIIVLIVISGGELTAARKTAKYAELESCAAISYNLRPGNGTGLFLQK